LNVGRLGEDIASSYLTSKKYKIIERNYYCRWGELDFICKKNNEIFFFEVKTRVGDKKGKPSDAVTYNKIRNLKRTITHYLLKKKLVNCKLSLDVISIELDTSFKVISLKHFKNILW